MKLKHFVFILLTLIALSSFFLNNSKTVTAAVRNTHPELVYNFKKLTAVPVQRTAVQKNYVYTVQYIDKNTIIRRARAPRRGYNINFSNKSEIKLNNSGHTQTWAHDQKNYWFVGAGPKLGGHHYWDTEIARVKFPKHGKKVYQNVAEIPHLTDLNLATDMNQAQYPGIKRSEAAVSPNHKYLLIATTDLKNNGHFALYNLKEVNNRLNAASRQPNKAVSLSQLHRLAAFHINHFIGNHRWQLNSIQGYGIRNNRTIYISREFKPTANHSSFPREVVKIAWHQTDPKKWTHFKVNHPHWNKVMTELEGIENVGQRFYLTVSYRNDNKWHTVTGSSFFRLNHLLS